MTTPPLHDTAFRRMVRATGNLPFFANFRVRLIILVLLAVLPALGLVIYTAIEQSEAGIQAAKEGALRAVRMAASRSLAGRARSAPARRQMGLAAERLASGARRLVVSRSARHRPGSSALFATFG